MNENRQQEELSQAIDQLNQGQSPSPDDAETRELLAVASLLKKSGLETKPPDHLLNESVSKAAAGLTHRNRLLQYSGLIAAAAAVFLFFGLYGTPSPQQLSREIPPPVQTPTAAKPEQVVKEKPVEKPVEKPAEKSVRYSATPIAPKPTEPPAAEKPAPARPEKAETIAPASVPRMKQAPVLTGVAVLKLPDRKPDSVTQDSDSGSIRQVFNKGTAQELILVQRPVQTRSENKSSPSQTQPLAMPEKKQTDAAVASVNRIVVVIHGQEVILEGRQSIAELKALANMLSP